MITLLIVLKPKSLKHRYSFKHMAVSSRGLTCLWPMTSLLIKKYVVNLDVGNGHTHWMLAQKQNLKSSCCKSDRKMEREGSFSWSPAHFIATDDRRTQPITLCLAHAHGGTTKGAEMEG